jgi:hypothetical protein
MWSHMVQTWGVWDEAAGGGNDRRMQKPVHWWLMLTLIYQITWHHIPDDHKLHIH